MLRARPVQFILVPVESLLALCCARAANDLGRTPLPGCRVCSILGAAYHVHAWSLFHSCVLGTCSHYTVLELRMIMDDAYAGM